MQVLIGFVAGLAVGIFFGELAAPLSFVGKAFISLLQITIIPYIIVALITGLGRLDIAEIGKLARNGGGVLLLFWVLGILLVLSMPLAYPDWPQRSLFQKSSVDSGTTVDFLLLFIPSNPFYAMANATIPALVVFCILIGVALTTIPQRESIIDPLMVLGEALAKVTGQISRLSPIGVFALAAGMAGTTAAEDLFRLQVHVVVLVLITFVTTLWIIPAILASVTPLSHRDILRELRTPMVTAFATGSSLVVLPMLATACKRLVEQYAEPHSPATIVQEEEEEMEKEIHSSVDILLPTFYSFPTIGSVLSLGFVIFGGWYVGDPLGASQIAAMLLGGIASLFGGTVIAMPFTLDLVGLPAELFSVFLSFDFLGIRLATLLSVVHYAAIALIGTFALQHTLRFRAGPILRNVVPSVVLILAVLASLRFVYSNYIVVPYTADHVLAQARLLGPEHDSSIHLTPPNEPTPGAPRAYSEIMRSDVFRACYLLGNYPLSFLNDEGRLVGFDIDMAHRFARRANLSLMLLPLGKLSDAPEKLNSGYCDAVFNSTKLSLDRTGATAQTRLVSLGTVAFVVPEEKRQKFGTWQSLREQGNIRIATSAYHAIPQAADYNLSGIEFVPLTTSDAQRDFFESDGAGAEAFIDTAEEGAAWTLLYPRFAVVVPKPVIRIPVVYLTAK
ncbi:MAG: cation:dicarboxylate symporter family transporter, partial [Gammaproteobacteria bacterium]